MDHPRTRGEKPVNHGIGQEISGSPPHTRGKGAVLGGGVGGVGITPAHAGKSRPALLHTPRRRDHPRTRGEKDSAIYNSENMGGSPPHTRGKGTFSPVTHVKKGITPAHAGKRS